MTNIKQKLNKANSDIKLKLLTHLGGSVAKSAVSTIAAGAILGFMASTIDIVTVDAKNDIGQDIKISKLGLDLRVDQIISGYSYDYAKKHDMLWSFWANVVVTTFLFCVYFKEFKYNPKLAKKAKNRFHAEYMLNQTNLSINDIEAVMRQADKTAVLEIVQNLAKKDRVFFDNFIADPTNIQKQELAIAIIKGHLKTHPNELDKLFKAFDVKSIPQEIRAAYKEGKKTVAWEQAVSQYNKGSEK